MTEQQLIYRVFNNPEGWQLLDQWRMSFADNFPDTIEGLWSEQGKRRFLNEILDKLRMEERKCKKLANQ